MRALLAALVLALSWPAPAATADPRFAGPIEGQVVVDGKPGAGSLVRVIGFDPPRIESTQTDGDGRVSFDRLPPGEHRLLLRAGDCGNVRLRVTVPGDPLRVVLE